MMWRNSNDPSFDPNRVRAYERGYRNGHLDRFLGLRLVIEETSPDADYATGYRDGVLSLKGRAGKGVGK